MPVACAKRPTYVTTCNSIAFERSSFRKSKAHQNGSVDANRSIDAFSMITNTIIMDRALVCLGEDNVIDIFPVKLN